MAEFLSLSSLSIGWRDLLDIALVTLLFYNIIIMVKQTRAVAAIYGLMLFVLAYFFSRWMGLITLNMLLENVLRSLFLIVVILFQRDIRQALTTIGAKNWLALPFSRKKGPHPAIQVISEAAAFMAARRIGALIIIERNVPLGDTMERGVKIEAKLSRELLINLFWPNSPLHDGAAMIREEVIVAAGCILPLSAQATKRDYGTRHRAALGITEETDALAVVVSEERGEVSIAVGGKLSGSLNEVKLPKVLTSLLERGR